jgi:hypothetical protein
LDARSTKDDQEYLFEPAPQYAFSPNQFRIAAHACARTPFYDSCQASAEHFEQCAEFLPLRNRGLGSLAVTVLPIPLARRAAATACAAVQSTAPLLVARLSPRAAVPMVLFGGNRRVGLTSGLVDLDARGRSPHVRSRRQPTVKTEEPGVAPPASYLLDGPRLLQHERRLLSTIFSLGVAGRHRINPCLDPTGVGGDCNPAA